MISSNGKWEYSKRKDGTLTLQSYKGEDADIVVPSEVDGLPVTRIGDGAFSRSESMNIDRMKITNTNVKTVVVSSGIKEIGHWAFLGLSNLSRVVLSDGLETIGEQAFERCSALNDIHLPDSVTKIGSSCFADCIALEKINLPLSLEEVADYLFCGCTSLNKITVPDSCNNIGNGAFYGCSALQVLNLPLTEIKIGDRVFDGCKSLNFTKYENCYYFGNKTNPFRILITVTSKTLTEITVHKDTEIISSSAFCNCREAYEIKMPEGLKIIGSNAFDKCEKLSSVYIPKTVLSIGVGGFGGCVGLRSVRIPSSVEDIQAAAFSGCRKLEKVVFDGGKVNIHQTAFDSCPSLCRIIAPWAEISLFTPNLKPYLCVGFIEETDAYSDEISSGYISYIKRKYERLIPYCYSNPRVAEYLCSNGFFTLDKTDELIDDERTSTECRAVLMNYREKGYSDDEKNSKLDREMGFRDYTENELKAIWNFTINSDKTVVITKYKGRETDVSVPDLIGDGIVTEIADEVFSPSKSRVSSQRAYEIKKIKSITIPETVNKLGNGVFKGSSVETVIMPSRLTVMGSEVFAGCASLISSKIPNGISVLPCNSFYGCQRLTEADIPDGITEIGSSAFRYCTNLKKVKIPDGVKKIVFDVFKGCPNLEILEMPKSVEAIYGITHGEFPKLTIKAPCGSFAESFAKNNGIDFSEI